MTTDDPTPTRDPFPFLVTARKPTAVALGALAVVFAIAAVWWGVWGLGAYRGLADADAGKDAVKTKPAVPDEFKLPDDKAADDKARSADYLPAGVWAGLMALLCAGGAFWVGRPAEAGAPAVNTRAEVLAFGAAAGLVTAMLGFVLAVGWSSSLTQWLNKGAAGEAKWVLISQGIFFAGLTAMFVSTQLGRAEQRGNVLLRRLMHGFNAVFQGVLILYVLVGLNILVSFKVPATLVTNDSAFAELTPESKKLLRSLDRPVHAYLIMSERQLVDMGRIKYENLYPDTRGLLGQSEDESPNFRATFLSPALDKLKINALYDELNLKDRDQAGILLVLGENRDVTSFIPADTLVDVVRVEAGAQVVFQGESKLMSELAYLTDSRSKMVVYFTQDHGELAFETGGEAGRTMAGVVNFLKARKINAEALKLDLAKPAIPENAALVVIAGPRQTIQPTAPLLKALGEYLKPSAPDVKPGKLLAFLPAFRGLDGKVAPSGLEGMLAEAGIQMDGAARLVTIPDAVAVKGAALPPDFLFAQAFNSPHPLVNTLAQGELLLKDCRPMRAADQPNPALRVTRLLGTPRSFPTWREGDYAAPVAVAWETMRADRTGGLARQKQFSQAPQALAFAVSAVLPGGSPDKPAEQPRMVVFASDTVVADNAAFGVVPPEFQQQIVSDSADWLREREASIGVKPRTVPLYRLPAPIELASKMTLLGMITVGLAGLGVAVWYSRRR